MIKVVFLIILLILELPFALKFKKAKEEFEIIRMTAILIIMAIIALFIFGFYKLSLFMIG